MDEDAKDYLETLIDRMDAVVETLQKRVRPDMHGDCEELAFAALQMRGLATELDCVSDDLALIAEGERYAQLTGGGRAHKAG